MILATTNPLKYAGLERMLARAGIRLMPPPVPLPEIQSLDFREAGEFKARTLFAAIESPVLVDDAGLVLDAYPGFPGPLTKSVLRALGIDGIRRSLHGQPSGAHMTCLITLCTEVGHVLFFQGTLAGTLCSGSLSPSALQLNTVFVPTGENQPLEDLKKADSEYPDHRVLAFRKLATHIHRA